MTDLKFDRLKMYFGEPYVIPCEPTPITIYQPKVGDIIEYGERLFYSMLNVIIGNPTSFRLQLWEVGIDWNKISDFELFRNQVVGLTSDATRLLFGDLDFTKFQTVLRQFPDSDDQEVVLYDAESDTEINEDTYNHMVKYIRTMFNIFPKVEKAKGKFTKQSIIDEEKQKLEESLAKGDNNVSDSMLFPLISACVNHPGFKYKLEEIKEMGIVQFMDSVSRLQVYDSTKALMGGMYSGMCDMKNVDKKLFNYMRDMTE